MSHSCHMIIFTISLLLCYINSAVLVHIVVGKLLGSVLLILCNVVGLGWRKRVHGRKQVHTFGQDNKRIHVLFLIRPPMLISCTLLTYELFTRMYSGYKNICFSLLLPKYFMQQRTRIKVINYHLSYLSVPFPVASKAVASDLEVPMLGSRIWVMCCDWCICGGLSTYP